MQSRRTKTAWAAAAIVIVCAATALVTRWIRTPGPVVLPEPTWTLSEATDQAVGYLIRANDASGRFVYRRSAAGDPAAPGRYNVLRHAGAIYALAAYRDAGRTADLRVEAAATSTRAAQQLLAKYVAPLEANPDRFAVWSDPKEEGNDDSRVAKLGGAALGLVALVSQDRASRDPEAWRIAQGLARFIASLQRPSGEYQSKFSEDPGKTRQFDSLYYPGEATLALTMLYERDPDPRWLDTALRGVSHLVIARRGQTDLPADHWLLIAIDRLLPFFDRVQNPFITKDEMVDHAYAIAQQIIAGQTKVHDQRPDLDGCFTKDGRTTPSATRLEGLLALEHALAGDAGRAAARAEVRASIVRGIRFLRRAQLTAPGPNAGGFPGAVGGRTRGAESEDEPPDEIRIDYVQHALSALMGYQAMCAADATGCP